MYPGCSWVHCGTLWFNVVHCSALQCTVVHSGALWCTVVHCGSQWCTVVHCCALWLTVVHCGALCFTVFTVNYFEHLQGGGNNTNWRVPNIMFRLLPKPSQFQQKMVRHLTPSSLLARTHIQAAHNKTSLLRQAAGARRRPFLVQLHPKVISPRNF